MISPQEIRTITFDKVLRGYRPEDVDALLKQLAEQIDTITAQNHENEEKLYILAQKIEEYRKDEDNLKIAFLNAQRMGENVIREAKQKAENILREAGIRADDMTRTAKEEAHEQELHFEHIKAEVAQFKNNVLGLYKQHIETLTTLPGDEEEQQAPEETLPEFFDQPAEPEAETPVAAQPVQNNVIDDFPDLSALFSEPEQEFAEPAQEESLWDIAQAESAPAEPSAPVQQAPAEDDPSPAGLFEGFQGIKFSD